MNDCVYNLPPSAVQEVNQCVQKDLQGYLELEVSHLNFVTPKSTKADRHQQSELNVQPIDDTTTLENHLIINNKNSASVNEISNIHNFTTENTKNEIYIKENKQNNLLSDSAQVKIVWCGERREDAAIISISYTTITKKQLQHQRKQSSEYFKLKTKRKYIHSRKQQNGQNSKPQWQNQHQQDKQHLVPTPTACLSAHNKLQYRICTSSALFLEYLRSCKPIEIFVSTSDNSFTNCGGSSDSYSTTQTPLGQAQLRLPLVLIKRFSHNIAKGHNFVYKTKVYALYKHNNKEFAVNKKLTKSGEIQLRFKMLFAPTAAAAATAVAAANHANVVIHEDNLKNSSPLQHIKNHRHNHHLVGGKSNKMSGEDVQGDKSKRLTSQSKSEEIVEAMKKLDAKLVAYLAGETEISSKLNNCEEENVVNLNLENNNITLNNNLQDLLPATKFNIFKSIAGIKLEMEALTLQPDGTKCINLLQNEIDPIFTVECQLSNELIKLVPRHDMFHIMQFESEKFHSLTQCTRFGQKAERAVKLDINKEFSDENANETELDFGRIHFTIWWREPGTCFNEMLGMGVLELNDLYNASLLEQCKRIEIIRRGKHLACLYFKIALQRDNVKSSIEMKRELFLPKQISADSDSEKTSTSTDNNKSSINQQSAQCGMKTNTATSSSNNSISGTDKASAQNKNVKVETTNFDEETSKVRLLKGFISANETRNMDFSLQQEAFLICRRFWLDKPATAKADETHKFNYQEQFSVINDEKFLQRVEKQYLHLELWQRMSCDDGNGNSENNIQPVGIVRMPLHQFFIAYRDVTITNHLCKGKLPVISVDAWAPVINCQNGLNVGEIKCLLAMGSDEQIKNLKESKGLLTINTFAKNITIEQDFISKLQPLQVPLTSKVSCTATQSPTTVSLPCNTSRMKKTSDLLDMLQKVLMTTPSTATDGQPTRAPPPPLIAAETQASAATNLTPLKPSNVKLFKFSLEIQKAIGLPLNPACKAKKGYSKRNASKRFPPNEAPSCYVTFQAEEGQYPMYKSHEGLVYATNIIEKSTQPQWQQRFRLAASIDYLKTPQKLFILKLLKKSSIDMAQGRKQPTPMEDAVIGLTALDLSAFVKGLHIAGTFNIVDFNGRVNGQLVLRCHPLEEIPLANCSSSMSTSINTMTASPAEEVTGGTSVDSVIDQFEQTLDLAHLNLGQAIKRKFTELEGISQRLRARLGDVTGTELPKNFNIEALNDWQPLEAEANDNEFDEFELDLNTPPINEEEHANDKKILDNNKKSENIKTLQENQGKSENSNVRNSE